MRKYKINVAFRDSGDPKWTWLMKEEWEIPYEDSEFYNVYTNFVCYDVQTAGHHCVLERNEKTDTQEEILRRLKAEHRREAEKEFFMIFPNGDEKLVKEIFDNDES